MRKQYWQSVTLMLALVGIAGQAQTLEGFGYRTWATGPSRPMLVVVANFATVPALAHNAAFYESFVFDALRVPSVNGYFREVSNGRFMWARAGVISMNFAANELGNNFTPEGMDFGLRRLLYHSNLVHRIMASGLFNFASVDANRNGTVTSDELAIAVVSNDPWENTSNRSAGRVQPAGSLVAFQGNIVRLADTSDFASVYHEIAHILGAIDLYWTNCWSSGLTLMSCTIVGIPDYEPTYHLDPWHKMMFGWCEPRMRRLSTGGVATIFAAQLGDATAPILLHENNASDFFLIEYRTFRLPGGPGYDNGVAGNGLVIWHYTGGQPVIATEGAPNLDRGGNQVWQSNTTTPYLTSGALTRTRLFVRPFELGATSITIEWMTESDIWIDFAYNFIELGTSDFPFNTLFEGHAAVSHGGNLWIKTGQTTESATLNKRVTVRSSGGPVVIGKR